MLGVVGHGRDVLLAYRQPGAAVAVAVGDRAATPQVVPYRVGIGHPGGVSMVEVGGPVRDGRVPATHGAVPISEIAMANSGQFATARRAFSTSSGGTTPSPRSDDPPRSSTSNNSGARL